VSLFKDQFIEIFNNSSEVIYADGLYVGHVFPDPANFPKVYSQMLDVENKVYLQWVYQIPGNGTQYPIQPSKSIMIALNAMNFKEGNPNADKAVNNTVADFEIYAGPWIEAQGGTAHIWDFDNPNVPNVVPIFINLPINIFLIDLTNPALVIFRKEQEFTQNDVYTLNYVSNTGYDREEKMITIPTSIVIDGVEAMGTSDRGIYKKLPTKIDASFTYLNADGGAFYNSQSLRRKIDEAATAKFGRIILQDLNNSFLDFEAINYPDAKGYNSK
jgi:hypothetical protein